MLKDVYMVAVLTLLYRVRMLCGTSRLLILGSQLSEDLHYMVKTTYWAVRVLSRDVMTDRKVLFVARHSPAMLAWEILIRQRLV